MSKAEHSGSTKAPVRQQAQKVEAANNKKAGAAPPLNSFVQQALYGTGELQASNILNLQRSAGNRAVGQLISRRRARYPVQAKLTVGAADDAYEREADRVATQVMSIKSDAPPTTRTKLNKQDENAAQRKTETVTRPAITPLTRRSSSLARENKNTDMAGSFDAGHDVEQQITASSRGGDPLPAKLRSDLEPRFGTDFSGVRVHTDAQSDGLNRSIGAQAFTHGNHIFMGAGKYSPTTDSGKHLLAHELTHVVQQTGSEVQRKPTAGTGVVQRFSFFGLFKKKPKEGTDTEKDKGKEVDKDKDKPNKGGLGTVDVQLQDAVEYEKNLGRFAFNHPKANTAAESMLNKMTTVLIRDAEKDSLEYKKQAAKIFGKDKVSSAGQVGTDLDAVWGVLTQGNLRERLTAIYNAMFGAFKTYIGQAMKDKAWAEMGERGLNTEKLKRRKRQLGMNPGAKDLYRDPGNPLDRKNFGSYEHVGSTRTAVEGFSERTVGELEQGQHGIGLSDREKALQFPDQEADEIGSEKVKWQEGGTYWKVNEKNKWVKKITGSLHMPVIAGPSGTMLKLMQLWEFLNKPISAPEWRLAVLGYMLSSNDHSFHEMMMTAADFGMPYVPGARAYMKVDPLTVWELRENVAKDGKFPHELAFERNANSGHFRMLDSDAMEDADDALDDMDDEDAGAVSGPGLAAVRLYTAFGYLILNPARKGGMLAGKQIERNVKNKAEIPDGLKEDFEAGKFNIKDLMKEAQDMIPLLESALETMPDWSGDLWRGEGSFNPFAYSQGSTISFGAFTSSTLDEGVAKSFADDFNIGPFKYILQLHTTAGKDLRRYSVANEEEILLPPGSKFKVTKRTKPTKSDKYYRIEMTQIGRGGTQLTLGAKTPPPPKVVEAIKPKPVKTGPTLEIYDAKDGDVVRVLDADEEFYISNEMEQGGGWTDFTLITDSNFYWCKTDELDAYRHPEQSHVGGESVPKKSYDHIKVGQYNLILKAGQSIHGFDSPAGGDAVDHSFGEDYPLRIRVIADLVAHERCRVDIMGSGKGLFVALDSIFNEAGQPELKLGGSIMVSSEPTHVDDEEGEEEGHEVAPGPELQLYDAKDGDESRKLTELDVDYINDENDHGDGWTEFNLMSDGTYYWCKTSELEAYQHQVHG